MAPPSVISGSARCAMRRNDQTETSIVVAKPARGQSVTRPPRASLVEKAIEWTRKSSRPQSCGDAVEHRFELAVLHHVHRQEDRRLDLGRQRLDEALRLVVEVGDRELGAQRAEGAGAAPGDRAGRWRCRRSGPSCRRGASPSRRAGSCGQPPVRARVWRAMISSSSVGTTRRATRLAGVEMRRLPAALAAGSSSAPSQARRSAMRARIAGAFSPMPAVNTKASRPPRAAASWPACRPQR